MTWCLSAQHMTWCLSAQRWALLAFLCLLNCGCQQDFPPDAAVIEPAAPADDIARATAPLEAPAERDLGKKLGGSLFPATGMFGGGPEFSDAELKRLVAELPPGITKLDLKMTKLSDAGLAPLQSADRVTEVYLPPQVTDAGLVHLAGMKNLEFIILEDARVTGSGLSSLHELPRLKRLFLNGAAVTDAGLVNLAGLTALEEIDLTNAKITDASLPILMQLPNLRSLDLTGSQVTRQAVSAFQAGRPDVVVNGP
jgi:hypothetical protein